MTALDIRDLWVSFDTSIGLVHAVDKISFILENGETLALVGETGCGKSVIASSILKLLPSNAKYGGKILFHGQNLLDLVEKEISKIRGNDISLIFQNPSLALNPVYRISEQVAEPLQIHRRLDKREATIRANSLLSRLMIDKESKKYPFQLSGGMNQRAMIASSTILSPKIIIADEPTKGLDAHLAERVMDELVKRKDQSSSSLLLITHDLSLAQKISDRIAVMYCGDIFEISSTEDIFSRPAHPYTKALLNCLPSQGFIPIPGPSPSMTDPPIGCKFHPRCPYNESRCLNKPKILKSEGRQVRCWLF